MPEISRIHTLRAGRSTVFNKADPEKQTRSAELPIEIDLHFLRSAYAWVQRMWLGFLFGRLDGDRIQARATGRSHRAAAGASANGSRQALDLRAGGQLLVGDSIH